MTGNANRSDSTRNISYESARVVDYAQIRSWGWEDLRLAQELLRLREEFLPQMPSQTKIDPQVFAPILADHPETWRCLTLERTLVGCWHFLSLPQEQMDRGLLGELNPGHVRPEILRVMDQPGWYDIYILTYVVDPRLRLTSASLAFARSMFETLAGLAKRGIYVDRLGANFVSREGLGIARGLGMTFQCEHKIIGQVYLSRVPDLLRRMQYADRRGAFVAQLRALYPAA